MSVFNMKRPKKNKRKKGADLFLGLAKKNR